jgi:hypothetical protein
MMEKTDEEIHTQCMQRFIDLANSMKDDGIETRVVSAGLMTASAVYSTYLFAGNEGRVAPEGITWLKEAFGAQLELVQRAKAEKKNTA